MKRFHSLRILLPLLLAAGSMPAAAYAQAQLPFLEKEAGVAAKGTAPAAPATAAEAEVENLEYALDEQTEITLSPYSTEKAWAMDLRRYGAPGEGQSLVFMGDLKSVGDDAYECRAEYDGRVETVRVERAPTAGQPLQLISNNLTDNNGKPVTVKGVFKPITKAERLERAKQRFEKTDALLSEQYAKTVAEVGKAGAAKLKEKQAEWMKSRDETAEFEGRNTEPPKEAPDYWASMVSQTVNRLEFLKIYSGKGIAKGVSGRYRDASGGWLSLEQGKGVLKFSVEVVRGRSSANGSLSGVAKMKGERALYKEVVEEGGDREPAELTFAFPTGHTVRIDGKNTGHHHGASAYFDGDYFKIGPLKEPLEVE